MGKETILETNYIEGYYYSPDWQSQKEIILKKWQNKRMSNNIKVKRIKSDTKGLRCYKVIEIIK